MTQSVDVKHRKRCAVCDANLGPALWELPALPLTGQYARQKPARIPNGIDQAFSLCQQCGHGQLINILDPQVVYDDGYSFRTSQSTTSHTGTARFMEFIERVLGNNPGALQTVLDVGCNDLHLLKLLRKRARHLVGIDPIWRGHESENPEKDIMVYGAQLEELSPKTLLQSPLDVVVCRHTLEHVMEPQLFLRKLLELGHPKTLYFFEFPGFEALLERHRFDQIFHQHVQYFSRASFARLIASLGGTLTHIDENPSHWGAHFYAFQTGKSAPPPLEFEPRPKGLIQDFKEKHGVFVSHMDRVSCALNQLKGTPIYGYGAAQMLPVLAYHLKSDLSQVSAVFDDDPSKDGMYWVNLGVPITSPTPGKSFEHATILMTAPDNYRPILPKVLSMKPRNILFPTPLV